MSPKAITTKKSLNLFFNLTRSFFIKSLEELSSFLILFFVVENFSWLLIVRAWSCLKYEKCSVFINFSCVWWQHQEERFTIKKLPVTYVRQTEKILTNKMTSLAAETRHRWKGKNKSLEKFFFFSMYRAFAIAILESFVDKSFRNSC